MKQEPNVSVIKTAKCPTLSGKSTLTYHIGQSGDELFIKVSANTGGGFFNEEWISLDRIREVLEKQAEGTITAVALYPLFRGKSANTPAFLLAVLIHEQLVETVEGKRLRHALAGDYLIKIKHLINHSPRHQKVRVAKTTAKKRTASRKKPSAG